MEKCDACGYMPVPHRKLYTLEVWVGDHWEVQDDMFAIGFDRDRLVARMHRVKLEDTSKNYRIIELVEEL